MYYYKDGSFQYSDNTFNRQKKQYEVDINFKGFLYNIEERYSLYLYNLNNEKNRIISNVFDELFNKYHSNVTPIDKGDYFLIPYEDGKKYVSKFDKEDFINKLNDESNKYHESKYKNGDTKLKEDDVKYINEELVKLCKEPLRLKSDDIVYDDGATYFILEDDNGNEYPVNLDVNGYRQELSQKIDLGIINYVRCVEDDSDLLNKIKTVTNNDNTPKQTYIDSDNGHFYVNFTQMKNGVDHKYKLELKFARKVDGGDDNNDRGTFNFFLKENPAYGGGIFKANTEEKENKNFKFYKLKDIHNDEHGQYVITKNEQTNTQLKVYVKAYGFSSFYHDKINHDYTIYVDKDEDKKEKVVNFAKNLVEVFNNSYVFNVNFTVLPDTFTINGEDATIDLLDSISNQKFKQKITVKEISKHEERFLDATDSCNSIKSQIGNSYRFISEGIEKKEINGKEKTLYYELYFGLQNEMLKVYKNIPHKYQLNGELNIKKRYSSL